jgi:16S rRNA (cytosine1402-N4)-methyltransferase
MATSDRRAPHCSVLLEEVVRFLAPQPGGTYCDATLGAGGHTERILEACAPTGRVIGIDRDPEALRIAGERLGRFGDRFIPVRGRFGDLPALLDPIGADRLDGIVADLGVSSMQIDEPVRGFSWQGLGPIDMRMDPEHGETALELILRLDDETLANILWEYGEERYSRRIARALKRAASEGELTDTLSLARTVAAACPTRDAHKHPATRTFQALRIAVNDELRQIHSLLTAAPDRLRPGGRIVIISFHSLEDRLVKHQLQRAPSLSLSGAPPGLFERAQGPFLSLTRKPVEPTDEEIARNPRARSARLRAAELRPVAERSVEEGAPWRA